MKEVVGELRQIHPQVIADIGMTNALGLLGIAHKLRNGTIANERFFMRLLNNAVYDRTNRKYMPSCTSPCCILGWLRIELNDNQALEGWSSDAKWGTSAYSLINLFHSSNPSDPKLAADAIERYVHEFAMFPWDLS